MSDEKKGTYWCCSADFGDHEETCANYKPVTAREDQPHCNDCGHAPHVGRVCDYGAAHGFEHDGCKCGPEDQPRPIPPDLFGIKVKLDSTMPVGQIDIEDAEGKRTTILEAQGAAPQTCPDCLSDDPLMCRVPIKEFHRHMGEAMLCCPNKFHYPEGQPCGTCDVMAKIHVLNACPDHRCLNWRKALPRVCECSEKDAAVCRSMPQHQPEYCRVKGAQPPQDAQCHQQAECPICVGRCKGHVGAGTVDPQICPTCESPKRDVRLCPLCVLNIYHGRFEPHPLCDNEEWHDPEKFASGSTPSPDPPDDHSSLTDMIAKHGWGIDEVEDVRKYASSSNAALLDKIQKLRFKLYHYAPFDGQSHTTACSIWREDGQGHAEGFAGSMGPCNCGALINYWRERAEASESKVDWAKNMIAHYLRSGYLPELSALEAKNFLGEPVPEKQKWTNPYDELRDLRSERDGLREALRVRDLTWKAALEKLPEKLRTVLNDSRARLGTVVESTEPLKYPSMDALIQSVPKARADKHGTEKG